MTIKLGINATSLLFPLTGIGQYTYHLCKQMLKNSEIEPCFFYGMQWGSKLRSSPIPGIERKKSFLKHMIPYSYQIKRLLQSYAFNKTSAILDVYHEPNYLPLSFKHKLVITVHDVSFIRYPETHPVERIRALEKFPEAVEKADAIITDSYFSARELMDYFPVDPSKIAPIHLGVTSQYHPRVEAETSSCLQRYGLTHHGYILVVGTLEPRKNLKLVIDAYRAIPLKVQEKYPLTVIGMKGWGMDQIDKDLSSLINGGHLRLLGYIPADDMPFLYAGAKLFVYPSIYEGFGLPPLEAMASGVPVIISNCASLPEVVGNAGIQVDADDAEMLRGTIIEVLEDTEKVSKMIQEGVAQAAIFSWERCASETVAVYKRVIG